MCPSTCNLSPEPPEIGEATTYPEGTILDGTYCLVGQVACGGMGEIYAATHTRLPGLFAIKVLQAGLATDFDILERFRREADVMATLRHPHVAQIVDYNFTPDGRPYLVMEHLDGADLAEVARQHGPMSPELVADFVRQIAAALAAAHAKGVVHLDLKPENVMVLMNDDRTPFIKVIDFGICKSRHTPTTGPRVIIGTPDYMSPEQVDGEIAAIDGRSDQFSLAVVAFYLLTGKSPWGAEEAVTTLYRICKEPPQALSNYLSVPRREIEHVLQKAMAKDPADRFSSVLDFSRAFDEAMHWDMATEPRAADEAPVALPGTPSRPLPVSTPEAEAAARDDEADLAKILRLDTRSLHPRRRRAGATALALVAGLVAWLASAPRIRADGLLSDVLRPLGAGWSTLGEASSAARKELTSTVQAGVAP